MNKLRPFYIFCLTLVLSSNFLSQNAVFKPLGNIQSIQRTLKLPVSPKAESSDDYLPISGPSFGYFVCWMRNKSLNTFIETYNLYNQGQFSQEMKPLGMMTGIRYGYSFSYENSKGLPVILYLGQQRNKGSLEAKLIDGYSRKIDYTQKDVFDLVAYFPMNKYVYLGTKMAWTTQVMDAYRMYGNDRVYDEQSLLTGVYRTSLGNLTLGLELKANIPIKKWIVISPALAYQSTFGKGASSYFGKADSQWNENQDINTIYFPSDYNGYTIAASNYTVLPTEALLKPRNRMVQASVSVLINLGNLFNN